MTASVKIVRATLYQAIFFATVASAATAHIEGAQIALLMK